jgi:hypothetical protein
MRVMIIGKILFLALSCAEQRVSFQANPRRRRNPAISCQPAFPLGDRKIPQCGEQSCRLRFSSPPVLLAPESLEIGTKWPEPHDAEC